MPKRKRYPKLPNGYGTIKYLGKNRRNPYGVYPPTKEFDENGVPQTPKALCYVNDWITGFAVLTAYKAGTYTKGMENDINSLASESTDSAIQKILADYNRFKGVETKDGKTFSDVYEEFYEWKYGGKKEYSQASKNATRSAFKNCAKLHTRIFSELRYEDLQKVIDECPKKHASLELIVSLFKQMYAYADIHEYCEKDYSAHVKINKADDDEHGVPFTDDELKILWDNKEDSIIEMVLIMCYSGFRISAYNTLEINLVEKYFKGGVKTKAGKGRIVPIHSSIYNLVEHRLKRNHSLLNTSTYNFRNDMYSKLKELGIGKHTPHDCRHTFSRLCDKYYVNENDKKRMLGHAFSDVTNKVYGHRDIEDLRKEIEKICC